MTNHAYFNLNANVDGATTVLEHELTMPTVSSFVEVDPVHLLPTGVVGSVNDAKFLDFRKGKVCRSLDLCWGFGLFWRDAA